MTASISVEGFDRSEHGLAVGFIGLALLLGTALAIGGNLAFVGFIGLVFIAAVACRPMVGVYSLVALTPLVAAQERGFVVPGLRIHEAILFAVLAGIGVRFLVGHALGHRVVLRPHRVDIVFAVLAIAGSLLPAIMMIGRGRDITGVGVGQLLVFPRFFLLYMVVRVAVTKAIELRRTIIVMGTAGLLVSVVALVQTVVLVRVNDLLLRFGAEQTEHFVVGKTTTTIGNAIMAGMYLSMLLAVALSLLFRDLANRHDPSRQNLKRSLIFAGAAGVYFLAAMATGQLSTLIACGLALVVGLVANRRSRYLGVIPLVGGAGLLALWPVFSKRLDEFRGFDELPRSWADRVDNLNEFFLPELLTDDNWLWGVRPVTSTENLDIVTGLVFLESGYLAMLWIGGVFLLFAAVALQITAIQASWQQVRRADPWVAAAAVGTFVGFVAVSLLMLIDSHLTFRASADLLYTLMALSMFSTVAAPLTMKHRNCADFPG